MATEEQEAIPSFDVPDTRLRWIVACPPCVIYAVVTYVTAAVAGALYLRYES